MQIVRIQLEKLFGVFDHDIPLNAKEHITILHGLNGFGKTTILRMLDSFFNGSLLLLFQIPFDALCISFDDDSQLRITQVRESGTGMRDELGFGVGAEQGFKSQVRFIYLPTNRQETDGSSMEQTWVSDFHTLLRRLRPFYRQISPNEWIDRRTGARLSGGLLFDLPKTIDDLPEEDESSPNRVWMPDWLSQLRSVVQVHLIETERLQLLDREPRPRSRYDEPPSIVRTVTQFAQEMAALLISTAAKYGNQSQKLERSFPLRLVKQGREAPVPLDQLRRRLESLAQRHQRLIDIGILESSAGEQDELLRSPQVDQDNQPVLSVYVSDMEQKLQVFDDLLARVELLLKIIKTRFRYKKCSLDRKSGLRFQSETGETLPVSALSSGEQHELVIVYSLLFKIAPGTLLLIDEPELSLHVAWQIHFIEDMQALIQLSNFHLLLATHSPQIVNDRWDLTVELKGPEA